MSADIIGDTLGHFGIWQFRAVLLIFLYKIPASWFMACIIFTAPAPQIGDFFCEPPSHVQIGRDNTFEWIQFAHPADENKTVDYCNVFNDTNTLDNFTATFYNIRNQSHQSSTTLVPCENFKHLTEYHSIITQYNLVCSREILVAVTQFFHLFGILMGGCVAFELLKICSPKRVVAIGMVTQILFGIVTGIAPNYEIHVLFRCLAAASCALMFVGGGVIFSDITSGKYKTVVTTLYDTFWSIGVMMLPALALNFTNWTHIYMAISFPTVLLLCFLYWTPDSPRWWIRFGHVDKVKLLLIEATKVNGTNLPNNIDQLLKQQASICLAEPKQASWLETWKTSPRILVSNVSCHVVWAIYIVNFMGMLVNVRASPPDLVVANTIICGMCEILGVLIGLGLILNVKCKWQVSGILNIVCGSIGLAAWWIPNAVEGSAKTVLMMFVQWTPKMTISTTLALLATCSTEMIEPEKKKMTAYSQVVFARIWLLTAPFVCVTNRFAPYTAQMSFAALCVIGGFITTLITSSPETFKK